MLDIWVHVKIVHNTLRQVETHRRVFLKVCVQKPFAVTFENEKKEETQLIL